MAAPNTVDTTAFNAMCKQASRMSAVPIEPFLRNEVGRILEKTIEYIPAAKASAIRLRSETALYSQQPPTLYAPQTRQGKKHRAGVKLSKNGSIKYFLGNRYPRELWVAMSRRRKESLRRKLGAIGLAKKSFWKIAQALGIEVKIPQKYTQAVATTGKEYQDTETKSEKSQDKIGIFISNSQPTAVKFAGGSKALRAAIAGRVKYFEKNIKFRVFNEVAKIAKAYPGIKMYLPSNG